MFHLAENLRKVAILLVPFMPETSTKMLSQLGLDTENKAWDLAHVDNVIKEGTKVIAQGEPLFVRLDKEEEIEFIKNAMGGK